MPKPLQELDNQKPTSKPSTPSENGDISIPMLCMLRSLPKDSKVIGFITPGDPNYKEIAEMLGFKKPNSESSDLDTFKTSKPT